MATNASAPDKSIVQQSTETYPVPESWLRLGSNAQPGDDETLYRATRLAIVRRQTAEHVSPHEVDISEDVRLHVLYEAVDGSGHVERTFRAAIVDRGDGGQLIPKRVWRDDPSAFPAEVAE